MLVAENLKSFRSMRRVRNKVNGNMIWLEMESRKMIMEVKLDQSAASGHQILEWRKVPQERAGEVDQEVQEVVNWKEEIKVSRMSR